MVWYFITITSDDVMNTNGDIFTAAYIWLLGPFIMLGTLLSPELSLGRVHMDGLTLSECYLTARNHMPIDFKDLTFYKFKFSPPFLFSNLIGYTTVAEARRSESATSVRIFGGPNVKKTRARS